MIELQPKQQFQTHENIVRELTKVVDSAHFHFALNFALAEFAVRAAPNAEQLVAVQKFIAVLLNLPFKEEPLPVLPVRTLAVLSPRQPEKH